MLAASKKHAEPQPAHGATGAAGREHDGAVPLMAGCSSGRGVGCGAGVGWLGRGGGRDSWPPHPAGRWSSTHPKHSPCQPARTFISGLESTFFSSGSTAAMADTCYGQRGWLAKEGEGTGQRWRGAPLKARDEGVRSRVTGKFFFFFGRSLWAGRAVCACVCPPPAGARGG